MYILDMYVQTISITYRFCMTCNIHDVKEHTTHIYIYIYIHRNMYIYIYRQHIKMDVSVIKRAL